MKTARREFLRIVYSPVELPGQVVRSIGGKGNMLYRSFGSTGAQLSALGVGGHHRDDFPGAGHPQLSESSRRYGGGVGREQHGYPPADRRPL